ncbi:MAG: hypothetical protein ACLUSP_04385 [Christensenellales bacterium]
MFELEIIKHIQMMRSPFFDAIFTESPTSATNLRLSSWRSRFTGRWISGSVLR